VAELEEKNKQLMANNQSTEKISKEFQQTSRGLTAVDWLNKAYALWDGEKFTNPKKAIEYLGNAIKLKPDYAAAYIIRGGACLLQGNNKRGCLDAQKACALGNCEMLEMAKGEGLCR
jgi:hypothetical protein